MQFEPVDGKTEIPLVDVLTVATPKAAPAFGAAGDQIWKYDAVTGWVKYWWRTANKNWVKQGETVVTADTVKTGDTLMFRRGAGAQAETITFTYPAKTTAE